MPLCVLCSLADLSDTIQLQGHYLRTSHLTQMYSVCGFAFARTQNDKPEYTHNNPFFPCRHSFLAWFLIPSFLPPLLQATGSLQSTHPISFPYTLKLGCVFSIAPRKGLTENPILECMQECEDCCCVYARL